MKEKDYEIKAKEFDKKFKVLVTKGGLNIEIYNNHKHFYALGYYQSI